MENVLLALAIICMLVTLGMILYSRRRNNYYVQYKVESKREIKEFAHYANIGREFSFLNNLSTAPAELYEKHADQEAKEVIIKSLSDSGMIKKEKKARPSGDVTIKYSLLVVEQK